MKINSYVLGGLLSGLACGGILDLLTGFHFFWFIFVIFGIQTGIIINQRELLKSKMIKPEIIGYLHLNNIFHGKGNLEAMGKKLFGKKWLGFIKETTYVHSEGFLTKKLEPIKGTPAKEFRKAIEKAGLVGMNFMDTVHKPKQKRSKGK